MVIDEWVRSVEKHQEFHSLNAIQTVLFATSHLSGRSKAWYRYNETQTDTPNTW